MSVIVNRIADVIATRLAALEGESVAGIAMSVVRPDARGVSPVHGQIAITYGGNVRFPEYDCPGNPFREAREQTFEICIYIRDESSDTQMTTQALEIYGQVVRYVKAEGATDWYTFADTENLAIDAEVGDLEVIQPNGALGGLKVPVMVKYRTPEAALDVVG